MLRRSARRIVKKTENNEKPSASSTTIIKTEKDEKPSASSTTIIKTEKDEKPSASSTTIIKTEKNEKPSASSTTIIKTEKDEKPSASSTTIIKTEKDEKPSVSGTTIACKRVIPTTYEWYFLDTNSNWIKYGNKDSSRDGTIASMRSENIEKIYLANESGDLYFHTNLFNYVLKFDTMEQMNLTTKKVRPVHRRPVKKLGTGTVAEVYQPSQDGSKLTLTQIEIEPAIQLITAIAKIGKLFGNTANKNVVNDQKIVKLGDPPPKQLSITLSIPSLWNPMKDDETMVVVPLVSTSQEYKDVMSHFAATLIIANTVFIKRVQNPYLFFSYQIRKKELSIRYGEERLLNVQKLFHGTQEEHVISICKENFDWRLHGPDGKASFGMGTYFSNSALLSQAYSIPNADGHRFMFLADVIVGTVAQGDSSMTRPPKHLTTGESYDTTVDNVAAPQKFVKYDKQDYYPSYIIEFW